jgi:diguanylate cyclase (GGDEF)-like protein
MAFDSIKIRAAVWAIILGSFMAADGAASAAAPATLTSLRAIHSLTNAQAAKSIPVAFQATVTYYGKGDIDLFVQDGDVAVYVEAPRNANLDPGDRVLVHGKTRASFRPDVLADAITRVGHDALPEPVPASFDQLIRSQLDCRRVTVQAKVRSANIVQYGKIGSLYLELLVDGGYIDAMVTGDTASGLKALLDAEIEITGVVSGKFDSKNQLTGIVLEVPSFSGVRILKQASSSLDLLPMTPMDDIMKGYAVHDRSERVRVYGTVTYYQPGSAVVLQDGAKSLWIETLYAGPLQVGDLADASGFPDARNGSLALTHSQVEDSGIASPITPHQVTWPELSSGANAFDLISVEGKVLMSVREVDRDEYVLVADGHLFSAIYQHPDEETGGHLDPVKQIEVDSTVHITGVSMVYYGSDPFQGPVASDVLLRTLDDITVVARPSWLTVGNLMRIVGALLAMVLAVAAWGWTLKAKVQRQTAALAIRTEAEAALERRMARLEKRRSQILEDINGSRPLAEIIEQVTELVSFRLQGVPCWCDVAGGARLGTCPDGISRLRVVVEEISARSGRPLGVLSAGFDPESPAAADELDSLSAGVKLAALAIETRRLYDDLRRRSEYDLLTDIHNRFSFDKLLDQQISEARQRAGIFGLVYIDLDEFKQVNDLYGHRVGDLYLQEVALRMKRQLRSGDMLARLGGDEFAALLPMIHSRAEAEEISVRLERSFAEPIAIEGYFLMGSASVGIAVYPEDGTSKDSLLSAADAAMYVDKHIRRQNSGLSTSRNNPSL